jgi:hypothetical protein
VTSASRRLQRRRLALFAPLLLALALGCTPRIDDLRVEEIRNVGVTFLSADG